jgi:hypothetical protein
MRWIQPTEVGSGWQGFTQVMPGGGYVPYSPLAGSVSRRHGRFRRTRAPLSEALEQSSPLAVCSGYTSRSKPVWEDPDFKPAPYWVVRICRRT